MVNVASTYHFMGDGYQLRVPVPSSATVDSSSRPSERNSSSPEAARGDRAGFWLSRGMSYANSKLASLLHGKELQRRVSPSEVRVQSVCPGLVSTGMLPQTPVGWLAHALAFSAEAGSAAPLYAALAPGLVGGGFLTGYSRPFGFPAREVMAAVKGPLLKYLVGNALAGVFFTIQRPFYGVTVTESSADADDETVAAELYDWSLAVVAEYLQDSYKELQ